MHRNYNLPRTQNLKPLHLPIHPLTGAPRFPQNLAQFNESVVYFCDPSGAGERAALRDLGFFTQAKPSPLSLGIELIRRALGGIYWTTGVSPVDSADRSRVAPSSAASSKNSVGSTQNAARPTRLLISPSCVNLIREFTSYRYADSAGSSALSGQGSSESQGSAAFPSDSSPTSAFSESPLKACDHALDALRYFFVGVWG